MCKHVQESGFLFFFSVRHYRPLLLEALIITKWRREALFVLLRDRLLSCLIDQRFTVNIWLGPPWRCCLRVIFNGSGLYDISVCVYFSLTMSWHTQIKPSLLFHLSSSQERQSHILFTHNRGRRGRDEVIRGIVCQRRCSKTITGALIYILIGSHEKDWFGNTPSCCKFPFH